MRGCGANALTYDARVCSAVHYQPYVHQLRDEIIQVASAVAGGQLVGLQQQQLFMRREEGGMDVHDPVDSGVRARAAAVIERGPNLRDRLQQLYPVAPAAQRRQAEGIGDADEIIERLARQGIAVGPYGLPQRLGIILRDAADALRPPAPASHLHAAYNKQASWNTRQRMLEGASELRDKVRIRSCGGPTVGHFFTSRAMGSDDSLA